MEKVRQRARFDWLIELGGASVFGLGCAYAALKLAPSFAWPPQTATVASGFAFFAIGMLVMRTAHGGPTTHRLADFAVGPVESDALWLDKPLELDELLLDTPYEEPLLLDTPFDEPREQDVLILEDALTQPHPASRVVQLFASQPMPTPGQLKERIDRHLAGESPRPANGRPSPPDASEALYAALDELRRSLR
jgi:hypothetical protein